MKQYLSVFKEQESEGRRWNLRNGQLNLKKKKRKRKRKEEPQPASKEKGEKKNLMSSGKKPEKTRLKREIYYSKDGNLHSRQEKKR